MKKKMKVQQKRQGKEERPVVLRKGEWGVAGSLRYVGDGV